MNQPHPTHSRFVAYDDVILCGACEARRFSAQAAEPCPARAKTIDTEAREVASSIIGRPLDGPRFDVGARVLVPFTGEHGIVTAATRTAPYRYTVAFTDGTVDRLGDFDLEEEQS